PTSRDRRPLRLGDPVRKGQLLAVVWSKDLGEKKSELIEALSRLRLDQDTLGRVSEMYRRGAATERRLQEAGRNAGADRLAVERGRRTLRTWRLTEGEVQAVERDAGRAFGRSSEGDGEAEKGWARVAVRAPCDGVVLEMNVVQGDLVDAALDLFKVADLGRLRVAAHAAEEDVPLLQQLRPGEWAWDIRRQSAPTAPALRGTVNQIGLVIDPNQHTAWVLGSVENPPDARGERRLRIGQLILAEINLPAPDDLVVVPRA